PPGRRLLRRAPAAAPGAGRPVRPAGPEGVHGEPDLPVARARVDLRRGRAALRARRGRLRRRSGARVRISPGCPPGGGAPRPGLPQRRVDLRRSLDLTGGRCYASAAVFRCQLADGRLLGRAETVLTAAIEDLRGRGHAADELARVRRAVRRAAAAPLPDDT